MFHIVSINLGEIKVGEKHILEFPFSANTTIKKVTSPCVCTDITVNNKERKITANYKPVPIPVHLEGQGYYEVAKIIDVIYSEDDGEDTLQSLLSQLK